MTTDRTSCPACGHADHGQRRCVVFAGHEEDVEIPGRGTAIFSDSHPCNCMGPVIANQEDVVDARMAVACTIFLNERRLPC